MKTPILTEKQKGELLDSGVIPPIDRTEIEMRLQLPILNICLAVISGAPGDLQECKRLLIDRVEQLVSEGCEAKANDARS
jgi:hypothetical protein